MIFVFVDPPSCKEPANQQLVIARNTSVFLSCDMDSQPKQLTFSWYIASAVKEHKQNGMDQGIGGHMTTKDNIYNRRQSLTYQQDHDVSTRSYTTISLQDNDVVVVCYAKNKIGRSQVPCKFNIAVVGKLTSLFFYF